MLPSIPTESERDIVGVLAIGAPLEIQRPTSAPFSKHWPSIHGLSHDFGDEINALHAAFKCRRTVYGCVLSVGSGLREKPPQVL
jgi:hypothetical protein